MIEALSLFWGAIAVGTLLAVTLSLYGVHLATRDVSLQSMAISQGAQVGVLLVLGATYAEAHIEHKGFAWMGGLILAATVSLLGSRLTRSLRSSKNTVFIALFLILLSASHCLVSVFPLLESHQSQAFFGDLVYLSGVEMYLAAVVSGIALVLLLVCFRSWSYRSFLLATFGRDSMVSTKQDAVFFVTSLLLIVTSVFSVGLMLTLSALFLPTMVLSFVKKADLKRHFLFSGLVAGLGVISGFCLTIWWGDYPTVPVVVLIFLLVSLALLFLINWRKMDQGLLKKPPFS